MLGAESNTGEERPGIAESYSSATNTSDLRIEAQRQKPADMLVAAGWSYSRLGAALLRLHSEWDGAEKPQKATLEHLEALAQSLTTEPDTVQVVNAQGVLSTMPNAYRGTVREVIEGKVRYRAPSVVAREQAAKWHLQELGLLFQKLKTLPDVRAQLILWCGRVGMSGGKHKVAEVLSWWLDNTCRSCEGQKWQLIPGTPTLSNRACEACHGSGEAHLPQGQDGRKMLGFVNDCLQAARSSMRARFKHQQQE